MNELKNSHVIVHRHRKKLVEKHLGRLEAHKAKGPQFAAAVERLLAGLDEVDQALTPSK